MNVNSTNNTDIQDNVYGAVITTKSFQEYTRFSARQLSTLRSTQPTWTVEFHCSLLSPTLSITI